MDFIENVWEYLDLLDQIRIKKMFPTNEKLELGGDTHIRKLPVKSSYFPILRELIPLLEKQKLVTESVLTYHNQRIIAIYCALTGKKLLYYCHFINNYLRDAGAESKRITRYTGPVQYDNNCILLIATRLPELYGITNLHRLIYEMVQYGVPVILMGSGSHLSPGDPVPADEFNAFMRTVTGRMSHAEADKHDALMSYLEQFGDTASKHTASADSNRLDAPHRMSKHWHHDVPELVLTPIITGPWGYIHGTRYTADYSNRLLALTRFDFGE